jgi:hypothetical protein
MESVISERESDMFITSSAMRKWLMVITLGSMMTLMWSAPAAAQDITPVPSPVPAEETAEDIVELTVESAESAAGTLEAFIQRLTVTPQSDLARVLMVVGGVILLIAGWRVYDYIVVIAGFLIGALLAASLVTTDNTLLTIAALLIGGLIGAAISYFLYYAAVFVIGAYIGIIVTNALATALSLTPVSSLVLLLGGLIGGLLLIGLSFEFLVLISALVGAQMLSLGLGLTPIWTLIFTIVGVIVQLGLIRAFRYDFRRHRRRITPFRRAVV